MAQIREMKTIGVAGTGKGTGVTHFCITLAGKLKSMGYKVAVLEDNNSGDFNELAENTETPIRAGKFTYKNIDYYLYQQRRDMAAIKYQGYDYLIVDNGNYKSCDKDFFALSTKNFIVSSARYWNFSGIINDLFDIEDEEVYKYYTYIFPFIYNNKKMQKEISGSMTGIKNIYYTPACEDPFDDFNLPQIEDMLGIESDKAKPEKRGFLAFGKKTQPKETVKAKEDIKDIPNTDDEDDNDLDEIVYETMEDDNESNRLNINDISKTVDKIYDDMTSSGSPVNNNRFSRPAQSKPVSFAQKEAEEEKKRKEAEEKRKKVESDPSRNGWRNKLSQTKPEVKPGTDKLQPAPMFPDTDEMTAKNDISYLNDPDFAVIFEGIKYISFARRFDCIKDLPEGTTLTKLLTSQLNAGIEAVLLEGGKLESVKDCYTIKINDKVHSFKKDEYDTLIKNA